MEVVTSNKITIVNLSEEDSSFVSMITYDEYEQTLGVLLKNIGERRFANVSKTTFIDFFTAKSIGNYYTTNIKQKFKFMAEKKDRGERRIVKIKLDLMKIQKAWLFHGKEKDGVVPKYLDATLILYENEDTYGSHGFVTQDVPKEVYKADKTVKGEILGNAKDFTNFGRDNFPKPGEESGTLSDNDEDLAGDLPF